ncbi:MAG: DDE-type integrase/transposase/recombinase [Leptospirales bacterium]|nr:DDE-type integrase/transposase/recombinase [Leptospirales bacterium]
MQQCYHSDIKIACAAGLLPPPARRSIPRSTRARWRSQDFGKLIQLPGVGGANQRLETIKEALARPELYRIIRALLAANRILRQALYSFKGAKQRLARARARIVSRAQRLCGSVRALYLRSLGITSQQIRHWQRHIEACKSSIYGLCRIRNPLQLARSEEQAIVRYAHNPAFKCWPLISIYFQMLEDGALYCGKSAFYRHCRALGLSRVFRSFRRKSPIGIRAESPGQILHADVTRLFLSDHRMVHVHVLMDNFSRCILAAVASFSASATLWRSILEGVLDRHAAILASPVDLIVDDGSENKGELAELTDSAPDRVRRLVAQKDITFSNSMAEAIHRMLKGQYIQGRVFTTLAGLQEAIDDAVKDYNSRCHGSLHGTRPLQAFHGEIPDRGRFSARIVAARALRIEENQKFDCRACKTQVISAHTAALQE